MSQRIKLLVNMGLIVQSIPGPCLNHKPYDFPTAMVTYSALAHKVSVEQLIRPHPAHIALIEIFHKQIGISFDLYKIWK